MTKAALDGAPPLSRVERLLVLVGVAFSPLWFLLIGGVHFTPADLCFAIAAPLYALRTRQYLVGVTRTMVAGVLLFLLGASIALPNSPVPHLSVLDMFQYVFIFFVAVPMTVLAARERPFRRTLIHALWVALTTLLVGGLVQAAQVDRLRDVMLWYSNQNQFFWLLASQLTLSVCLILDRGELDWPALLAGSTIVLGLPLLIGGTTLSAILMAAVCAWFIALRWGLQHSLWARVAVPAASLCLAPLGFTLVILNWEFVRVQGSIPIRLEQYQSALGLIQARPVLGYGLESSEWIMPHGIPESVHNIFLAYWLEAGLLGILGMVVILVDWLRGGLLTGIRSKAGGGWLSFGPTAVFAGLLVVALFQPVPVRRYIWVMLALSWSVPVSSRGIE